MITLATLQSLVAQGESETLELKRAGATPPLPRPTSPTPRVRGSKTTSSRLVRSSAMCGDAHPSRPARWGCWAMRSARASVPSQLAPQPANSKFHASRPPQAPRGRRAGPTSTADGRMDQQAPVGGRDEAPGHFEACRPSATCADLILRGSNDATRRACVVYAAGNDGGDGGDGWLWEQCNSISGRGRLRENGRTTGLSLDASAPLPASRPAHPAQ